MEKHDCIVTLTTDRQLNIDESFAWSIDFLGALMQNAVLNTSNLNVPCPIAQEPNLES